MKYEIRIDGAVVGSVEGLEMAKKMKRVFEADVDDPERVSITEPESEMSTRASSGLYTRFLG